MSIGTLIRTVPIRLQSRIGDYYWPVALLLIVAGGTLRFWSLATRPDFEWDEPVYASVASNLAENGVLQVKDEYGTPTRPYLYHPPFYFYLLAGWFRVFGSGIPQARYLAATGAVLALVLLAFFLRRLLGNWGLLALALVSFNGWVIFTNRVSWIENTMLPLGVAGLMLYWRAFQRPSLGRFLVAGVLLGFVAIYKHQGAYFLVAVLIHWLITRQHHRGHQLLVGTSFGIVTSYVVVMALLFESYWDQTLVQFRRAFFLEESRGALTGISQVLAPLVSQYRIFFVTMLLSLVAFCLVVIRLVQMAQRRSVEPVRGQALLFSWLLAGLLFFGVIGLKLPQYYFMVLIPLLCYLIAEAKQFTKEQSAPRNWKTLTAIVMIPLVIGGLGAFTLRIVTSDDDALRTTAAWARTNLPLDATVITEESIGTLIPQPYCKMWRTVWCDEEASYVITYESHTQKLPGNRRLHQLIHSGKALETFEGFSREITVYRISP